MLFDLRGRGRRRLIQGVYLFLALLIGGGLIFFGVGGTGVGLFNNDNSGAGGGTGNGAFEKQLARAEKQARVHPRDAAAWASLAQARFQAAGQGDNSNPNGGYTPKGQIQLRDAGRAWRRYLALNPKKVNVGLAQQMTVAFAQIGDYKGAVTALEALVQEQPNLYNFKRLAQAAYLAGQERTGDLAAAEAVQRAPKASRPQVRSEINAAKTAAKQNTGGASTPTPPSGSTIPIRPKSKG